MKVNKSESVRMLLSDRPHLSAQDVAHAVGCDLSLVYGVRRRHAKKIVAKRMRQGVSNEQVTLMQATSVLQDLVKDIKDLHISFDHSRDNLELLWRDGSFQVPVSELNKTIDSIKHLSRYEQ